ncbi:hypothetical protein QTO34_004263 [Cnephaeus nilssonii]|uniref:Ubiquitin carboxyl-terminal hydrolase n=1 Tax=Cnephaeus nilssonii TaxID=3371016 RepID=A0AA40LJL0_CNENI|nr:hypothetical protein QTO34_004263 [Eptesicus nilssonii]
MVHTAGRQLAAPEAPSVLQHSHGADAELVPLLAMQLSIPPAQSATPATQVPLPRASWPIMGIAKVRALLQRRERLVPPQLRLPTTSSALDASFSKGAFRGEISRRPCPRTWRPLLRTGKRSFSSGTPRRSNPLDSVKGLRKSTGAPAGLRDHHPPRESGCAPRGPLAPADTPPPSGSWSPGRPRAVGAGLQNLGNTCYANAALQCLSYTPPLARYVLSGRHSGACRRRASCALCALQAHVTRALLRPGDVIVPEGELLAGFHAYRQEDAHEFLLFTLDALQRACVPEERPPSPPGRPSQEDATLIRRVFGGHWRSRIQCLRCQGVSDTLDPYLDIGLDIQAAQSVTQALELLVRPERLGGADGYQCGKCRRKVPATKTLRLHAASRVLTLVLKRFSALADSKVERDVRYPEHLDLRPYLSQGRRAGPLLYRLYAVLVHSGRTCHSGHYFCYVRTAGGRWFKMDNAQVTACDASEALSQRAYVLFYVQTSELEGDSRGVDPTGPESAPNFPGPGSEEPAREAPVKHTSLEQRRRPQEPSRPKPQFNLREVARAVPAEAVLIHQSRDRGGTADRLLNHPAGDVLPGGAKGTGQGPGPRGGAKANRKKKKKKQGHRSVPACQ